MSNHEYGYVPTWKGQAGAPFLTCNLSATEPDGSNYGGWIADGTGGFKTAVAALDADGGGDLYVEGRYSPTGTIPTLTATHRINVYFAEGAGFTVTADTTYYVYSNFGKTAGSQKVPTLLVVDFTGSIYNYKALDDAYSQQNSTGILFGGGCVVDLYNCHGGPVTRFGMHVTGYASIPGGATYDSDTGPIRFFGGDSDSCGQNTNGGDGGPIKVATGSQTHDILGVESYGTGWTNSLQIGVDIISTQGTSGKVKGIKMFGGKISISTALAGAFNSAIGLHLEEGASGTGGIEDEEFVGITIDGQGTGYSGADCWTNHSGVRWAGLYITGFAHTGFSLLMGQNAAWGGEGYDIDGVEVHGGVTGFIIGTGASPADAILGLAARGLKAFDDGGGTLATGLSLSDTVAHPIRGTISDCDFVGVKGGGTSVNVAGLASTTTLALTNLNGYNLGSITVF